MSKQNFLEWLLVRKQNLPFSVSLFDPPGHGRIGGLYFHTWCPYVRTSVTKTKKETRYNAKRQRPVNKIRATTDIMREIIDNLLAVAWWVILNSTDLFFL